MQLLFLWENLHFGIHLLLGLALLSCFWLYIDVAIAQRRWRLWLELIAWLLLAVSFFMQAITVESPLFMATYILLLRRATMLIRFSGYLLLAFTVLADRLQKRPQTEGLTASSTNKAVLIMPALAAVPSFIPALLPAGALFVSFVYWRRATIGLERHLRPLCYAFFILALFETAGLGNLFRATTNPTIFQLVAPFGPVWMIELVFAAMAAAIAMWWVARYLLRRMQTQLFMIFVSMSVGIFLVTTVTFSTYLMGFTEANTLQRLSTDARTVDYVLQRSKDALVSDAEVVAKHSLVPQLIQDPTRYAELSALTREILLQKKETTLLITDAQGQVIARGEYPERVGDSLSDDALVSQARQGTSATGIVTYDGPLAPVVSIRAAVPIMNQSAVVGTVLLGTTLDNVYVDGLKTATGLDVALYAGNTLSASTITSYDATNRWIGTENTNTSITNPVLAEAKAASGAVKLLNTSYLAAYLPLQNVKQEVVGMLMVGTPETDLIRTASQSLQLTFVTSIALMLLSFIPSFYFANKLSKQLQ